MQTANQRAGFTLLEIVIAVTIMAIMAGIAVPLASKAFESKARGVTNNELDELADAVGIYFEDVLDFPGEIDDLWIEPAGVVGWTGPYLPYLSTDQLSGDSDWSVDAWSRPYVLSTLGDALTITSPGADAIAGNADDLEVEIDATPIRREHTRDQLDVLNQAVELYNGINLPDTPLSTTYSFLIQKLVDDGFMPTKTGYEVDAWGDDLVLVPAGLSPPVKIGSVNLN